MKATITTVAEYNTRNIGYNMKFANADGSLKTKGFVVENDGHAQYFSSKAKAEAEVLNPAPRTEEKIQYSEQEEAHWDAMDKHPGDLADLRHIISK